MADPRLTEHAQPTPPRSEVRLELTDSEGHQIWALTSERPQEAAPAALPPAATFLAELPAIAWRWRRRVVLGALLGAALAVVYLVVATPVYVVRALVHIEQRASVLQQYDALRSGATFVATQAELIQSPHVIGLAFDRIGLPEQQSPGALKRLKQWVRSLIPGTDATVVDPRTAAVLAAQAELGASPVLGTDLMAVNFRTPTPARGVDFLNALVDGYRDYVRSLETQAHAEGLELLQGQSDTLSGELDRLQQRYDADRAQAPLLGEGENALSVQRLRLEEHAKAHVEAQNRRIELENRLTQMNGSVPQETRNRLVEDLQLTEALLADLRASRRPAHPDVQQTEQRIALLREQIHKNSAERREAVEAELRAARQTEDTLSKIYQQEWSRTKQLEQQRVGQEHVRSEIDQLSLRRDAVNALLREKEMRVLALESGHSGTVVRLIDPPQIPSEKSWPQPPIVLVGFVFLGTMTGMALSVVGELRARRRFADD